MLRFRDPRRFGSADWVAGDPLLHPLLASLGPEPLGPDFTPDYLAAACRGRKVAIKQHIMNGRVVVGVGNIYASEALFRAGIHPVARGRTDQRGPARRAGRRRFAACSTTAIRQGGTTLARFRLGRGPSGAIFGPSSPSTGAPASRARAAAVSSAPWCRASAPPITAPAASASRSRVNGAPDPGGRDGPGARRSGLLCRRRMQAMLGACTQAGRETPAARTTPGGEKLGGPVPFQPADVPSNASSRLFTSVRPGEGRSILLMVSADLPAAAQLLPHPGRARDPDPASRARRRSAPMRPAPSRSTLIFVIPLYKLLFDYLAERWPTSRP
jgi:hypothetical protein